MAAFCVNTHSKLFKDTAKRLDISEDILELIAYKYGNQEGTFGKFPSDEYILNSLEGKQDVNASEAQIRLWELRYSQPRVFETIEEANQFIQDTQEYFDNDSIVLTTTNDGKFRVSVAEPFNQEAYQKEVDSIKEKAIADGTFMKVRNKQGELVDSNLNEQQWLQVRTKAFKGWFGDWENDPANASKVVDENGEPLVVYHTSDGSRDSRFNTFDTNIEGRESAIYHTDSEYMSLSYLLKDTDDLDDFGSNRAIQYLDSIINDIQTTGHIEEFYDFITGKQQTAFDIINSIVSPFNITVEKKSTYTIDEIRALQDKLSKLSVKSESESIVKADFVNIKNPLIVNGNGRNWNDLEFNGNIESTRSIEDYYRDSEYDGIIFRSIVDYGGGAQFFALANKERAPHNVYAAYNPNQIKSATENRGSFSESDNIYKLTDTGSGGRMMYSDSEALALSFMEESQKLSTVIEDETISSSIQSLREDIQRIHSEFGLENSSRLPNIGEVSSERAEAYNNYITDLQNRIISKLESLGYKITVKQDSNLKQEMAISSDGKLLTLLYNRNLLSGNPKIFEYAITHELVHAITSQAITNTFRTSSFTQEEREFTNTILKVANEARKNGIALGIDFFKDREKYLHEFIANALTNPNLQNKLANIGETKARKSLWKRFSDAVRNFVSKYLNKDISGTYLDTLLSSTFAHIDNFNSNSQFESNSLYDEQQAQTQPTEQEPMWAPPKVEREFHTKEVDLVTKIDNLYSGDIDASEISAEADKAVDWISDQLTQYMENHELVYKKFFEDNPSFPSKEEVMKKLDSISSRREMLGLIGMDKMLEFYKEEVLSMTDENADIFDNMDDAESDKYDAIKENLDGLIQLGYARFLSREGFGFGISDIEGEKFTVTEARDSEEQVNPDDFNGQADIDGNEEVRNQQDHWQIENATRDIMDNASAKVKQAIADCYVLEDNGKVDENGNKQYDNVKDSLNRNERVVPIKAVRSIVKWVQGATTLSQMTAKLAAKQATNPWISQIVTRLQDTTGNESDFQSQFFNTFCKFFQPYSIVKRRADGTFYTMIVNAHPALNDAMNAIGIQYKTGAFPLVNEEGIVQMSNVEELSYVRDTLQSMGPVNEENRAQVVELIGNVLYAIGAPQPSDAINRILTNTLKDLVWANTKNIVNKLTAAADKKGYNPLQFTDNPNGIRNYIKNIISPFTEQLEDTLVSAVYDGGKMYQSNITPSWTTKLFTKMHLPDKEFRQFIIKDFGQSEWFIEDPSVLSTMSEEEQLNYISDHPEIWRLPWIGEIVSMSESERQKAFQHKVQLNFNKQNYMRGMNDLEYVMSVFTEYFSDSSQNETGELFGYYRFPMISNKPSNEFIRFKRHTDVSEFGDGRREILDGFVKIFHQELSRIQTVEMRNLKKGDAGFIANFDANEGKGRGLQFNFLDYLNEYLSGNKKDKALGKLIDRKLHGTETTKLTSEELTELDNLVRTEVANHLDALAERLINTYKQNGLFESLKNIEHIGKSDAAVEEAIREFAWNDNYANANILEFLVTDKAYYKNEEDLQKRLAQVHSPGTRGNWEATDFKGKPISDGKVRVLKLADYAKVVSSTIDNVAEVFDRKIAEADESDRQAWIDLKESVLEAYRDINVVDGQAFVSPTAYRKKAIAFGEWTKEDEEVYNELKKGKANLAQTKKVFNPRKPFTYGKVNKKVNAGLGTPIKTLNYGVQYKDSEYLLIMADALLRGQNTSRPNLLGALFDLMEQSAETNPTRGIDFVVFESGVKTGLTGPISINEFIEDPNGKEKAFTKLWNSAFNEDGTYNENFIDVLDAEDYTTQQTVPEHFMHGDLQWGSQVRVIIPSDLESFYNGQDVYYEYVDPQTGKVVPMQADEIRAEWEKNTAAMIQKGIDTLSKELGLSENMSIADRNVLISKLLQREIWSNPRYGVDPLLACSVDEYGNFRIPLGDPIQSKRIEQLLNSIVKNRINKQKVAGGTLVEVTNFGTSKRLEKRYKDKNGNLLTSKRDYLAQGHTEEEFKQYLEENQNGIAYYECYAPAWTR